MKFYNTCYLILLMCVSFAMGYAQTAKTFPRNVVIEEGTGLTCGFCGRGIVAMDSTHQAYPDRFIGVAIHVNDALAANVFPTSYTTGGLPNAMVNRDEPIEVGVGNFKHAVAAHLNDTAPARISVEAHWTDAMQQSITLTTQVEFGAAPSNAYTYAYLILEDSITGLKQLNYYAGGDYGYADGLSEYPESYYPVFSHVVRGAYPNPMVGAALQLPQGKLTKEWQEEISCPTHVKSKKHLRVVAILLNNEGTITNAATSKYVSEKLGNKVTGIQTVSDTPLPITTGQRTLHLEGLTPTQHCIVYRVDGSKVYQGVPRRLTLASGIYLVQVNGRTQKVWISE